MDSKFNGRISINDIFSNNYSVNSKSTEEKIEDILKLRKSKMDKKKKNKRHST